MINLGSWKYISLLILSALSASLITYLLMSRYYGQPRLHMMTTEERDAYIDKMREDHYTKRLPEIIELYEEIAASYEEEGISDPEWRQSIEEMKASIAKYEAEKAKEKAADELQPEF